MIPVAVIRARSRPYKIVEWKLHNVCNFNCSFCSSDNKDGTERWLPLDTYKTVCEKLMVQGEAENKIIWFQFTGGEPTLYPELRELLYFIKQRGHKTSIISNGSRTIRWWKELAELNVLDQLFITHHPEQDSNPQHTIDVVNLFNTTTSIIIQITGLPTFIEEGRNRYIQFIQQTTVGVTLKPIVDTPAREIIRYSPDELTQLTSSRIDKKSINIHSPMIVKFDNGQNKVLSAQELLKQNLNNFYGWHCTIGKDRITIQGELIYRGICRQGGIIGTIHDSNFEFVKDNVTCRLTSCTCLTDLQESKYS
jgi:organic radical activating enzyme